MRQGRIDLSICAYTRSIELEAPAPSLRVEALTNRGAARCESGEVDDVLRARALKDVVVRQIIAVQWNEELGAKSDTGRQLRFLP